VAHGRTEDTFEDDRGLSSVPTGGFPGAVEEIRRRLGDLPMLLAGMVGSNRGWREAPYVEAPAGLQEIAARILWVDPRTGIVPGVCQRGKNGPDVMRGEEVQLVGGVAAGLISPGDVVCHPGTHAKWARVEAGRITGFRTMMTGEIFALLREHSILAELLAGTAEPGPQFYAGVEEAIGGESPLSALFRIRSRALLEGAVGGAASRASGILIGSEVVAALSEFRGASVTVVGRSDLCELYSQALSIAGQTSRQVDGAAVFLAGIAALAEGLS
jgi:2-dehydro-3-deoxygalactonokinase